MTVQSLAFGGYMLGAAELWFEVHMQKADREAALSQAVNSQSKSDNLPSEMTIHVLLVKVCKMSNPKHIHKGLHVQSTGGWNIDKA